MHFERWVFTQALIEHFSRQEPPVALGRVLEALSIEAGAYENAEKHHRDIIVRGIGRDDLEPAKRFARQREIAVREIAAKKPTLDDLVRAERAAQPPASAEGSPDDTAMLPLHVPKVVLPFGGPAPVSSSTRPPVEQSQPAGLDAVARKVAFNYPAGTGVDETQAMHLSDFGDALPFRSKLGPAVSGTEDTDPAGRPPGKKL